MLSDNIRDLRGKHNLTQDELADMLLVTRTAVSKWETGKGYPNIDSIRLLSEKFNIPIDVLLSDEDFKERKKLRTAVPVWLYLLISVALFVISIVIISIPHELDKFIGIGYEEKKIAEIDIRRTNLTDDTYPETSVVLESEKDISDFCYYFENTEAAYRNFAKESISESSPTYLVTLKYKNGKSDHLEITGNTFFHSESISKAYIKGRNAILEYIEEVVS